MPDPGADLHGELGRVRRPPLPYGAPGSRPRRRPSQLLSTPTLAEPAGVLGRVGRSPPTRRRCHKRTPQQHYKAHHDTSDPRPAAHTPHWPVDAGAGSASAGALIPRRASSAIIRS